MKLRVTTPFFLKIPSVVFELLVPVVHVDCKLGTTIGVIIVIHTLEWHSEQLELILS